MPQGLQRNCRYRTSNPLQLGHPTEESYKGRTDGTTKTPTIVYVHGGGWVLGNLETHDRICRVLAEKSEAIVVAVDYRLSPEAKFPSAVHEVAAVAKHLHENADQYGIDADRMGMAGDSGGAHLNLAATLYLRQEVGDASYIKALCQNNKRLFGTGRNAQEKNRYGSVSGIGITT